MRDQIARILFEAAVDSAPDRITPIVVAAIGAVAAVLTTLIVAFARKPSEDSTSGVVAGLREDVKAAREDTRIAVRRVERRDKEIDRLQTLLWQHGVNPLDGSKVTPP